MASVNKVILVGNLGANPDVKTFDNGSMIANVSIATSEKWTDKQTGEQRENTEWHKVVFNDRLAQIVSQYLRKGSSVYVEGSLRTRKWTDNNGVERYSTEIRAISMQMLGGKQDSQPQNGYQHGQGSQSGYNNQDYQSQSEPRQPTRPKGGFKEMEMQGKTLNAVQDDEEMPF